MSTEDTQQPLGHDADHLHDAWAVLFLDLAEKLGLVESEDRNTQAA